MSNKLSAFGLSQKEIGKIVTAFQEYQLAIDNAAREKKALHWEAIAIDMRKQFNKKIQNFFMYTGFVAMQNQVRQIVVEEQANVKN